MTEKLLHFIWKFRYFNTQNLTTDEGESLQIVFVGNQNTHQGPDFFAAKIKVGNTLLVGNVEVHVKASDWHLHKHHLDKHYKNVILHVVWENDKPPSIRQSFQTLTLQPLVANSMLERYTALMQKGSSSIPCTNYLKDISPIFLLNWKERLATERLQRKATEILSRAQSNKNNWEETFWQLIAKNFGAKVNADCFLEMATIIPQQILSKHKYQLQQIEALLLGTCHLLPEVATDAYSQHLQREYVFLSKKFSLKKTHITPQLLRMRPANFPTIRLAQLASLVQQSLHLFSKIIATDDCKVLYTYFDVQASEYWHTHYQIDKTSNENSPKAIGKSTIENILINTVVPVVFAYGLFINQQSYKDKALQWLQDISKEKNSIISHWKTAGIAAQNAMETQALIELKQHYCDEKKCLDCHIGMKIIGH